MVNKVHIRKVFTKILHGCTYLILEIEFKNRNILNFIIQNTQMYSPILQEDEWDINPERNGSHIAGTQFTW